MYIPAQAKLSQVQTILQTGHCRDGTWMHTAESFVLVFKPPRFRRNTGEVLTCYIEKVEVQGKTSRQKSSNLGC